MLSVGLLGARGFMGSTMLPSLVTAHRAKQLCLVLLHRPESDTSSFPEDVEKLAIDLDKGNVAEIRDQLEGLEVVISAISGRNAAHLLQLPLLEAISTLPNFLTFFPSEWATPFRQEDYEKSPFLSDANKQRIRDRAKELGIGCTVVKNATVPYLLFGWPGLSKFDPNKNTLRLFEPQGKGTRGLTSKEFTGAAITHLLLSRSSSLPNTTFSLVEHHFSSDLLIETFTKINGTPPKIDSVNEEDYEKGLKDTFFGAMGVASDKGLAVGCDWPGEVIDSTWLEREAGWKVVPFEKYVRDYLGEDKGDTEWKEEIKGAIQRKERE